MIVNAFVRKLLPLALLQYSLSVCSVFAQSVEQSSEDAGGDVTQVAGDSNSIEDKDNSNNSSNTNATSVVINIRSNAEEIVKALPESSRRVATEVSEIAVDLVEASASSANATSRQRIAQKLQALAEGPLSSYEVKDNPFLPPINKVQLFCENRFRFSYRGHHENKGERICFYVNNNYTTWLYPGDMKSFTMEDRRLEILYLEYLEKEKAPHLYYKCRAENES